MSKLKLVQRLLKITQLDSRNSYLFIMCPHLTNVDQNWNQVKLEHCLKNESSSP